MSDIVTAEVIGDSIRYYDRCGGWIERTGGSANWRCNNPGGIPHGNPPRSGEIGSPSGDIAIFTDYQHGVAGFQFDFTKAAADFPDITLESFLEIHYPTLNTNSIINASGLDGAMHLSDLSEQERTNFLNTIRQHLGWEVGTQTPYHAGPGGINYQSCAAFDLGGAGPGGSAPAPDHPTNYEWHPPMY